MNKYKNQYTNLNHVKINDNTNGYLYVKNNKVTGIINVETKQNGEKWIQGLELFGKAKGNKLSYALLNEATNNLNANRLSVRNSNKIAKHIYNKSGWKEYSNDGYMSYMKYIKE